MTFMSVMSVYKLLTTTVADGGSLTLTAFLGIRLSFLQYS